MECGAHIAVEPPAEHPWMADCMLCDKCGSRALGCMLWDKKVGA